MDKESFMLEGAAQMHEQTLPLSLGKGNVIEKCGICCSPVTSRGVLDCCSHVFCFSCIDCWSAITNICPLCKLQFKFITFLPAAGNEESNEVDTHGDFLDIFGKGRLLICSLRRQTGRSAGMMAVRRMGHFPSHHTSLMKMQLCALMETVAKFEQDSQQMLQSLALRILLWLVTPVIVGIMQSALDTNLNLKIKDCGFVQGVLVLVFWTYLDPTPTFRQSSFLQLRVLPQSVLQLNRRQWVVP